MAPARTSGRANPSTTRRFAAPVNCVGWAEVTVAFWLGVVVMIEFFVVVLATLEVDVAEDSVLAAGATEERPVTPYWAEHAARSCPLELVSMDTVAHR